MTAVYALAVLAVVGALILWALSAAAGWADRQRPGAIPDWPLDRVMEPEDEARLRERFAARREAVELATANADDREQLDRIERVVTRMLDVKLRRWLAELNVPADVAALAPSFAVLRAEVCA